MTAPLSILFVDDEPNVLQGLRRSLRSKAADWNMVFAPGGPEALAELDRGSFDIVVTDMRMPGMDGAALLAEVRRRQPDAVRFVLSGQSEEESIYRSIGVSHQYLSKPCDPAVLIHKIDAALGLRRRFRNPNLRALIGGRLKVPSQPQIHSRLVATLSNAYCMSRQVVELVQQDPGLATRVLQAANSAFFGAARNVSSIDRAIDFLGLDVLKALALKQDFLNMLAAAALGNVRAEEIFDHCRRVAVLARAISLLPDFAPARADECYTVGLLHDLGILILAGLDSGIHAGEDGELYDREVARVGVGHDEVIGYILGLWGLPDPIVEAIACHHDESRFFASHAEPEAVLYLANAVDRLLSRPTDDPAVWTRQSDRVRLPAGIAIEDLRLLGMTVRELPQ